MKCEIIWNSLMLEEWQARFQKINRSNILQSYHYAQAMRATAGQNAQWGLIKIDNIEAGLVQILEAKTLLGLFHAVILDRGPLWFDGYGSAVHVKLFFDKFCSQFPQRWGRKRRVLPEIEQGAAIQNILLQCGLDKNNQMPAYQTLWWDLGIDDQQAKEKLKKNWLGSLKKAEKSRIEIEWDDQGQFYAEMKAAYLIDRQDKQYHGLSPKLLDNLALFSTQDNPMIIGKAKIEGKDIAGVLFLTHGSSATYQIGWSSQQGRELCAHHLLLWLSRQKMREYNITQLDLGGINDEAKGLSQFKKSTGAQPATLAGYYA